MTPNKQKAIHVLSDLIRLAGTEIAELSDTPSIPVDAERGMFLKRLASMKRLVNGLEQMELASKKVVS
ncbi:hypothetical protein C5Y96_17045 [Blastopirellula marina]|uniref:Uncharacterized protein n=1 Tax=Blastopirellula marina TaxID=124 RepID=A0A2S8F7F5_9BACT|nr:MULTISPECIES: hypothetical protein [Pirellulaceae]PQO28078.1 hypothetical protein C5Y96_17045 [Blastopirellula marina]RCS48503.1 hypothetical protein DTL36_17065 [Bremerella cremea]